MRVVCFTHSLASCWNHGNAHFLRGVLSELLGRGHEVRSYEPADGWSRQNLTADHGGAALDGFARHYPELARHAHFIGPDLDAMLEGADLVLVHEWTDPELVAAIGRRRLHGDFLLLFHDTHHRAVSDPGAIGRLDLSAYDGVLAFGEALAQVYRALGWGARAFVWHEAADTRRFHPPAVEGERNGIVWIGNWGDEERSEELRDYLLRPAAALGLKLDVHGVRYPPHARAALAAAGAQYRGWLPNAEVPSVFARHMFTVHVPRRFYATHLPGIPTIRVFEALACGIPLVCAPWVDAEALFQLGRDFLMARSPGEMLENMRALAADGALRRTLAAAGRAAIEARHSCAHRVDELLEIATRLGSTPRQEAA
ncbi:MAG TPA: glycosyltransferase [Acetobacteraceae bacterium]